MNDEVDSVGVEPTQRVDVVVVSYNSGEWLRRCIEPLTGEPAIGVIVVDNASADDSVAVAEQLPVEVVALDENIGFGSGCNIGWRRGTAPYVLFLNPDTEFTAADVLRLADILERTDAGAVAPKIINSDGTLEWSLRRFPDVRSVFAQALFAHRLFPGAGWTDEIIRDRTRYDREGTVDWASGACLLVRRDALDELDGFDESFFMYGEDVDLCKRLWDANRPVVYTPQVACTHAGGASAPRWKLLPMLAANRTRYAHKHLGPAHALAYRTGIALGELTHIVVSRGMSRRLGHAQALAAVLRTSAQS